MPILWSYCKDIGLETTYFTSLLNYWAVYTYARLVKTKMSSVSRPFCLRLSVRPPAFPSHRVSYLYYLLILVYASPRVNINDSGEGITFVGSILHSSLMYILPSILRSIERKVLRRVVCPEEDKNEIKQNKTKQTCEVAVGYPRRAQAGASRRPKRVGPTDNTGKRSVRDLC